MDASQRVNSDFKVKILTRAAAQTDEFEYLIMETVVQPSTEEYFVKNEGRVRFYTSLPGFYVRNTTVCFVSLFVSLKSKTLILFQEGPEKKGGGGSSSSKLVYSFPSANL